MIVYFCLVCEEDQGFYTIPTDENEVPICEVCGKPMTATEEAFEEEEDGAS